MEHKGVCFQIHQLSVQIKISALQPLDFHYHSEFRCSLMNFTRMVMIEATVCGILIHFKATLDSTKCTLHHITQDFNCKCD